MFFKSDTIDSVVSDIQKKIDSLINLAAAHDAKAGAKTEKIDFVKASAQEEIQHLQTKIADINTSTDVVVTSLEAASEAEKANAQRARALAANFTKLLTTD